MINYYETYLFTTFNRIIYKFGSKDILEKELAKMLNWMGLQILKNIYSHQISQKGN